MKRGGGGETDPRGGRREENTSALTGEMHLGFGPFLRRERAVRFAFVQDKEDEPMHCQGGKEEGGIFMRKVCLLHQSKRWKTLKKKGGKRKSYEPRREGERRDKEFYEVPSLEFRKKKKTSSDAETQKGGDMGFIGPGGEEIVWGRSLRHPARGKPDLYEGEGRSAH